MRRAVLLALWGLVFAVVAAAAAGGWPWRRRCCGRPDLYHPTAHRATPPDLWPAEPASPARLDPKRFAAAFGELCGRMPDERRDRYAAAIAREAERFEIDPFLLAALVHDRSSCRPTTYRRDRERGRIGLTRIPVEMHAHQILSRVYSYYLREDETWVERKLPLEEHYFCRATIERPATNLYFAAAFLSIFAKQHADLEEAFEATPHRHYVSHWFQGDRVREVEPENRVLRDRRRLLDCYRGREPRSCGTFRGAELVSPLDGAPRMVIDYFGNLRGKKSGPGHRGIDLDGHTGEPVRSVAAGTVVFAGIDIPGGGEHRQVELDEWEELDVDEIGPGGRYVAINHGNELGSFYMHLDSVDVHYGDQVAAGDAIGTLGSSGTERSMQHLHLEIRVGTDRIDPAPLLAPALVDPWAGRKTK
jgi:murein DD-endopeptidase MepM/ murein hydrolase activator NlpD